MPTPNSFEGSTLVPWINREYIENAIRSKFNDNTIKIVKLEIIPATAKGDNYASVMSRIRLDFESKKYEKPQRSSFVLKTSLDVADDQEMSDAFEVYAMFDREMKIYDSICPKLKDILQRIGYTEDLVPDTVNIDFKRKAILFEDLAVRNFIVVDRTEGLNIEHAKLLLKKMAKFHAASAILNEMVPGCLETYDRGTFNKYSDAFAPFFTGGLEVCARMVKGWEGYEQYGEKLSKLKTKIFEYGRKAFEARHDQLNVLIHGDLWCNNAMFKYNKDNKPIDVLLIDFQLSCWSSPAIDLHYFLNTSLMEDLRINNIEELVQFYFTNLTDTLRSLQYRGKIPTLLEFWVQYMEKSIYALTSAFVVQPIMINKLTEDADASALFHDDDRSLKFKQTVYNNEKVKRNLRHLLPVFDRRGLLDVN